MIMLAKQIARDSGLKAEVEKIVARKKRGYPLPND